MDGRELDMALAEWRRRFEAGDYFEAHEALEAEWRRRRAAGDEAAARLLKGLIHAAVGLHHRERGNAHGARVKLRSALGYLEDAPDLWRGLDLGALRRRLAAVLEATSGAGEGALPPGIARPHADGGPSTGSPSSASRSGARRA